MGDGRGFLRQAQFAPTGFMNGARLGKYNEPRAYVVQFPVRIPIVKLAGLKLPVALNLSYVVSDCHGDQQWQIHLATTGRKRSEKKGCEQFTNL